MKDERFTLKPEEKFEANLLKQKLIERQVPFKHDWEICKYVLVSSNLGDSPEERVEAAFQRIKGRIQWERDNQLDKIDRSAARKFLLEEVGGHIYGTGFAKSGRPMLCTCYDHVNLDVFCDPKNIKMLVVSLMERSDLGVTDLAEARIGYTNLQIVNKMGLLSIYRIVGPAKKIKEVSLPIHANRVKQIVAILPPAGRTVLKVVRPFLPNRIKQRFTFAKNVKSCDKFCSDQISVELGGELDSMSGEEWLALRLAKREETIAKIRID